MKMFKSNRLAPLRRWALMIALALFALPSLRADLTEEQVAHVKAATGLVLYPAATNWAVNTTTAFCISESGLFVTCKRLPGLIKMHSPSIVLAPGEKDEKVYPARLVRLVDETDLAILKVTPDQKLPALTLGDAAKLAIFTSLSGYGYRMQDPDLIKARGYQVIKGWDGTVGSLTKKKGVLAGIDFTRTVEPGFTGGPVLNADGEVVGVVSGPNTAVPVTLLLAAMESPIIEVAPDPSKPTDLLVSLDWLRPPVGEPKVSVEVGDEGQARRVEARKTKEGEYRAQTAPASAEKVQLHVTLEFANGKMEGTIPERDVAIAGKPKPLREIHELQRAEKDADFTADGKAAGPMPELKALPVNIGGNTIKVDGRKARRIEIQAPPPEAAPSHYQAFVKLADGREFSSEKATAANLAKTPLTPPLPSKAAPPPAHESIPPAPILSGNIDLTEKREIALPNPISDVVSAQDGRSLLLYMNDAKQIAVFDVLDLKIRGFIKVGDGNALIAGGSRYVLAVCPGSNVIERFSIQTLQRERTVNNPFGDFISFTMGRSSPNVALIVAQPDGSSFPKITAFDADRMAAFTELPNSAATLTEKNAIVRASADGRTFAMMCPDVSPTGFTILNYRDGTLVQSFYQHDTYGLLVPSADGSQIFTSASGVYTNKGVPIIKARGNGGEGIDYIPSYHPMYYLAVSYRDDEPGEKRKHPRSLGVFWAGSTQPLLQTSNDFKEMQPATENGARWTDPITLDKRYHLFPQLNLLLTIPPTNDKIVARPFNVRRMLDERGIDYLYVTSLPPIGKVSTDYYYQLAAASRAGGVNFALQSGPSGLTISKEGEVKWKTPAQPVDETVIVSLKDKSGQELLHSFRVTTTP